MYRTNRVAFLGLAVFFIAVLGYAYFEARNVIYGPSIALATTMPSNVVHEQMVLIRGVAKNIVEIQMNGRIISTTEDGSFKEAHLLAHGYNKILLTARDKIGRVKEQAVEIVYEPRETANATNASTTRERPL